MRLKHQKYISFLKAIAKCPQIGSLLRFLPAWWQLPDTIFMSPRPHGEREGAMKHQFLQTEISPFGLEPRPSDLI